MPAESPDPAAHGSRLYGPAVALAAAFVALACVARFVPGLSEWDAHVAEDFVAWRSAGWSRAFWVFTLLGDDPLMATLTAVVVVLLAVWGRRAQAAAAAVGLAGAWAAMHIGKWAVGRPRPPASAALVQTPTSHSMPSGHALISVVFFGLLAYLLFVHLDSRGAGSGRRAAQGGRVGVPAGGATGVTRRRNAGVAVKVAVLSAGAGISVMVGLSRVYLGVHWLSDVIAGWCLGGAVLLVALWLMARWRAGGGPRGLLRQAEPWPGRRARKVIVVALALVACAVAGATAWADPLLF